MGLFVLFTLVALAPGVTIHVFTVWAECTLWPGMYKELERK